MPEDFENNECKTGDQGRTSAQENDPLVDPRTVPADQPPSSNLEGTEELLVAREAVPGAGRRTRPDSHIGGLRENHPESEIYF